MCRFFIWFVGEAFCILQRSKFLPRDYQGNRENPPLDPLTKMIPHIIVPSSCVDITRALRGCFR